MKKEKKPFHPYAIASFVMIFIAWLPLLNIFTSVLSIVFGYIALKEIKTLKQHRGRTLAIIGLVFGILTILMSILGVVLYPEIYFSQNATIS